MYDVIVVGARCAGAPTAMLLARAGYRVLLIDRARFPSDTLSTHYLHLPAVRQLAKWKLLDELLASGCPPMRRTIYHVADATGREVRLVGSPPPLDGHDASYAPRRYVLDTLLVRAATAAGAEFRENCAVTGLLRDESGCVTGVRFRTDGQARETTEHASLVVGADGKRSAIARLAGAEVTRRDPLLTCAYYSYWDKVPTDFELHERPGRWVGALRTHDATLVAAYFPQKQFPAVRADAQRAYLENIRGTAPELYERLQGGTQLERLYGTGDQQNFFRRAHGPGWVLIGDAAHHKDSITARGITDAFAQAQLLVGCLGESIQDRLELNTALHRFGECRDALLDPVYQGTIVVAHLQVQPDRLALLQLIGQDQELTNRYFAAVAGILTVEELYTPDLLAQL
ncbi:monooxygenase FAD-binding protein [Actinobacteria bacterium OV450]|nr:monooxygenase FAD-binding protein [Actinobacteria bacterium OV450]